MQTLSDPFFIYEDENGIITSSKLLQFVFLASFEYTKHT